MILALDMGNTNIVIGCIDSQKTYFVERVTTDHAKTGTEYAINIKNILEIHQINPSDIEGAIVCRSAAQRTDFFCRKEDFRLSSHAGRRWYQNRHEYHHG